MGLVSTGGRRYHFISWDIMNGMLRCVILSLIFFAGMMSNLQKLPMNTCQFGLKIAPTHQNGRQGGDREGVGGG